MQERASHSLSPEDFELWYYHGRLPEEETRRLSDTSGMLHRFASVMLRSSDAYYCTVEGKRVKIVR